MLKELCNNLNFRDHLPKAFEKCGLYPLNAEKPKERIPSVASTETIARHIDQQILKSFEVKRFGGAKKPRGKKVPAGQSYTNQPVETSASDQNNNGRVAAMSLLVTMFKMIQLTKMSCLMNCLLSDYLRLGITTRRRLYSLP